MSLRSAAQTEQPDDVLDKGKENDTSKEKKKERKGKRNRKQKHSVTFTLLHQRNVHKDMVNEDCECLNIKYKQWQGEEQPKSKMHKSHIEFGNVNQILEAQMFRIFVSYARQKNICVTTGT